jgi:hypothetical protein
MRKYSDEEVRLWYERYKKLGSTRKVASFFKVSRPTVKRRFLDLGLKIKADGRKYFFNNDFFDNNSPELFYWAGFIAADGCICKNSMILCLSIKDIEHIKKFKKIINHDGKIHTIDQRPVRNSIMASFALSSKDVVNKLKRFNIGPRKSLTYNFPHFIVGHEFENHFVRGYIDGDGSFTAKKGSFMFSVRGTKNFLIILKNILHKKCGTNINAKIYFDSGIYKLQYSGRHNLIKVRDYIYKNSNNNMELYRKKEIAFDNIVDNCFNNSCVPVISTNLNGDDVVFYKRQRDAEKDGFSHKRISECVNGRRIKYKNRKFRKATIDEIQLYTKKE